ncbi:MAG TPA: hypothetical protein DIU45_15160 [Clostridium sp.]|nr:hypothetical protein [Clostridium sp.]
MEKISLILNRISAGTTVIFGGLYIIESLSYSTSGMVSPAVFSLAMGSIIFLHRHYYLTLINLKNKIE